MLFRSLCCANWLGDFAPVSIKMAKDQNLSLNPTKISGICGRLMCCLKYEHDTYLDIRRELPNKGERIKTPDGMGIVLDAVILTESVKVRHILGENEGRLELSEDIVTYKKDQLGDNPVRLKQVEDEPVDDMRFDGLNDYADGERLARRESATGAAEAAGSSGASDSTDRSAERRDRGRSGVKPQSQGRPAEREQRQPQKDRSGASASSPGVVASSQEKPFRPEKGQQMLPPKKLESAQSNAELPDGEAEGSDEEGQKPRRRRPRRRKKK